MNDQEAKLRLAPRRQTAAVFGRAFAAFIGWCLVVIVLALLLGA